MKSSNGRCILNWKLPHLDKILNWSRWIKFHYRDFRLNFQMVMISLIGIIWILKKFWDDYVILNNNQFYRISFGTIRYSISYVHLSMLQHDLIFECLIFARLLCTLSCTFSERAHCWRIPAWKTMSRLNSKKFQKFHFEA